MFLESIQCWINRFYIIHYKRKKTPANFFILFYFIVMLRPFEVLKHDRKIYPIVARWYYCVRHQCAKSSDCNNNNCPYLRTTLWQRSDFEYILWLGVVTAATVGCRPHLCKQNGRKHEKGTKGEESNCSRRLAQQYTRALFGFWPKKAERSTNVEICRNGRNEAQQFRKYFLIELTCFKHTAKEFTWLLIDNSKVIKN